MVRFLPRDARTAHLGGRIACEQPVAHRAIERRSQNRVGGADRRVGQRPHRRTRFTVGVLRPRLGLGAQPEDQRLDVGRPQLVERGCAEGGCFEVLPRKRAVQRPRGFLTVGDGESCCTPMGNPVSDRG